MLFCFTSHVAFRPIIFVMMMMCVCVAQVYIRIWWEMEGGRVGLFRVIITKQGTEYRSG